MYTYIQNNILTAVVFNCEYPQIDSRLRFYIHIRKQINIQECRSMNKSQIGKQKFSCLLE